MTTRPLLCREWQGRKVRTLTDLTNGITTIPTGTTMTVRQHRGHRAGLSLSTDDPCPHCGVHLHITRVGEHDVELLPIEQPRPVAVAVARVEGPG